VLLLDKSTSRYIELLDAKEYNFAVNSVATDLNRFKIILVPSATTAVSSASVDGIRVVGNNGTATLLGIAPNSMVRVLDVSGKLIFNGYINEGESINVPQNGLYLFHITSNNQLTKLKTLIQ
nr:T9SS type A sorting domain-containing protein [Paludibacter sp.]